MGDTGPTPFREAIKATFEDPTVRARYPEGMTAGDVLDEMRATGRGDFPLCTLLDAHDEMTALYGRSK